jgi:hypothetical protein
LHGGEARGCSAGGGRQNVKTILSNYWSRKIMGTGPKKYAFETVCSVIVSELLRIFLTRLLPEKKIHFEKECIPNVMNVLTEFFWTHVN